jgi:hypothetical protein
VRRATTRDNDKETPLLKAAWVGTEVIGKVTRFFSGSGLPAQPHENPPQSLEELAERLREDYCRDYFVSGLLDRELYAPECEFSDPFSSFTGRDRFYTNLQNLGLFITGAEIKTMSFDVNFSASPPNVQTKQMVKLQLNLPWKPVLAWPWGVRHEISPLSNQIVAHQETWDVSASDGLMQVFRAGPEAALRKIKRK